VHTGGAAERPANPGRTPAKEWLLDTRWQTQDGDARNVINAWRTGNTETRATAGYHPRRGGRYDSREDRSPTPEPPGTRVFSREIRTASFPQRFRQPTSITKYNGETDPRVWINDYRVACQLGGATTDEVIIRNLPCTSPTQRGCGSSTYRPARSTTGTIWSAPSWETFRARTCALETPGIYAHAPRSSASRSGTSDDAFPSAARSSERGPVRDRARLPRGHHVSGPCVRAWAQPAGRFERAVRHRHQLCLRRRGSGGDIRRQEGQTRGRRARGGQQVQEPHQKNKRGKKGKKPRREAREQGRNGGDDEALAVGPARRGPRPPLEALGFSTTC
jgi:hypothetical protein